MLGYHLRHPCQARGVGWLCVSLSSCSPMTYSRGGTGRRTGGREARRPRLARPYRSQDLGRLPRPLKTSLLRQASQRAALAAGDGSRVPSASSAAMAASVPEYGRQSYWEARHRSERDFDWYLVDFPRISPLLGAYASQSHSIFEAGCGTSTLARDLYDNGYGKVTAVDYSRSAVDAQRAAQGGDGRRPGLSYELADLRRYVPESPPPGGCPCRARPFVATSSRRARRRLGTPPRRATADAAPAPSSPPPKPCRLAQAGRRRQRAIRRGHR